MNIANIFIIDFTDVQTEQLLKAYNLEEKAHACERSNPAYSNELFRLAMFKWHLAIGIDPAPTWKYDHSVRWLGRKITDGKF